MSNLPVDRHATAARPSPRSATGRSTGTRLFALAGHVKQPRRLRGRDGQDHLPRPRSTPRCSAAAPRRPRRQGDHPRRRLGPVVRARPARPAASARTRSARPARCSARASIIVMDSTTCMVRAAWRITKFFSRESCGQCTPVPGGVGLARADPLPDRARRRPRGGPRPAARRQRQHLARSAVAAPADDDLRARSVDPVLDPLGHRDVPRRVPPPRQRRRLPAWLSASADEVSFTARRPPGDGAARASC